MAAEVVLSGEGAPLPSIVDFYSGRDVLITGATGFMGKCLLEKLLRSVPDLGSVFVLTREKKGKTPEQRTKDLLASPVNYAMCVCSIALEKCVSLMEYCY